jgi:hypothetical protein
VEDATDADDVCRLFPEGDEVSGMVEIHREPRSTSLLTILWWQVRADFASWRRYRHRRLDSHHQAQFERYQSYVNAALAVNLEIAKGRLS